MLMIVAHHYVVNSGLMLEGGPLLLETTSGNSIFSALFGAWGKTGINCFMMITGYFMCTSKITLRKFVKLMGQIYLYKLLLFSIFLITGYETLSALRIVKLLMPFWGMSYGFISSFIVFWLTIPFWSMLVQNMNKRQHELLLILSLGIYTLFGSIPSFSVSFNYVTWFGIIFLIASYIRIYQHPVFEKKSLWGWVSVVSSCLAMLSIVVMQWKYGGKGISYSHFFLYDCNKIFAVAIAVSTFLWFKNMNIKYCKIINSFGAATFGVLLIHANSDAMRTWLWEDTLDIVGHCISMGTGGFILYSVGVVLAIFIICNLIDQLRIATFEKLFLNWYDRKLSAKADAYISRTTS